MDDDVERELEQFKLIVEDLERRLSDQGRDYPGSSIPVDSDAGNDYPGSSVTASLKPRPSRNSGGVALPEPFEPAENASEASWQEHVSILARVPKIGTSAEASGPR